jgi:hypothetical protein
LRNIDDRMALDQIERTIFDHVIVFLFPRVGSWALFRAMRAAGIPASLNVPLIHYLEMIGKLLRLGNDGQIIEPALRAAASRLNFCRYWELRRILHTLDVADSRGFGIALRNRVRRGRQKLPCATSIVAASRRSSHQLRGFEEQAIMRIAGSQNRGKIVPTTGLSTSTISCICEFRSCIHGHGI